MSQSYKPQTKAADDGQYTYGPSLWVALTFLLRKLLSTKTIQRLREIVMRKKI